MAETSKIEWTDATWNPITGCSLVSEGCRHCYAATLAAGRLRNHPSRAGLARVNAAGEAKFTGEVRFNEQWLDQPIRWKRPRRIFVCAHGDLFHEAVPDEWIDRVFAMMMRTRRHSFQVLTKRPARARAYLLGMSACLDRAEQDGEWFRRGFCVPLAGDLAWPLPNVWLGVSCEDQATADARVPILLDTPAAVRFVSYEPALGPIAFAALDTGEWCEDRLDALTGERHAKHTGCIVSEGPALDWIIAGGESGPGARPAHPDWFRRVRDDCAATGPAFLFKQWGAWKNGSDFARDAKVVLNDGRVIADQIEALEAVACLEPDRRLNPTLMRSVGKARAGRLLDGVEHNGIPG